jgi:hypothetical protein
MGTDEDKAPGNPTDPLARLRGGDRHALATLFDRYRDRPSSASDRPVRRVRRRMRWVAGRWRCDVSMVSSFRDRIQAILLGTAR